MDLHDTNLTSESVPILIEFIQSADCMRSLDLSGNVGFGVQEAVEVTKALATSKCAANIESVNLSSTAVHQHGSFVDDGVRPPCAHNTDECYVLR